MNNYEQRMDKDDKGQPVPSLRTRFVVYHEPSTAVVDLHASGKPPTEDIQGWLTGMGALYGGPDFIGPIQPTETTGPTGNKLPSPD